MQRSTQTILACIFIAFCEGFDLQAAGVAAVGIGAEFRPTPDQLGTFFSASTLGLLAGALVGGRLSDSFGRKRTLVVSVVVFGLFSLLTAAASGVAALSWARLLTGLGLGGALPNVLALANESSAAQRRNANVALVYAGAPLGGAVASLLSLLSTPAHWRVIFVVGGVLPLLLVPLLIGVLHESAQFRQAAATAARTTGSPLAIFSAGRATATLLLWLSSFLALLILYLLLSWLPTLLVGVGFSKSEAAGVQIAFNVGGACAALLIGQLLEGRARNPSLILALLSMPALILLLSRAPPELAVVVLIVFALGCSVLAIQGFLYATAPRCYPMMIRGFGVGATVAMGRAGSIVGPKLGGLLKAAGHSPAQLLGDILPVAVMCSVAALLFAWHTAKMRDA